VTTIESSGDRNRQLLTAKVTTIAASVYEVVA
jgi:hypothetical protein